MLIDSVVDFCNQEYLRQNTEYICDNCNHIKRCPGNCKSCLEEIHFQLPNSTGKKDYDCYNLINYYVCSYTYKYASEMWYLLNKSNVIKTLDEYKIISIGCGACPDLMAFESYLIYQGSQKAISYFGIDKNLLWKPIHNIINQYNNSQLKTRFSYNDAIKYFRRSKTPNSNILVLQYIISYLCSTGQDGIIEQFFDDLISNIILFKESHKPFVILINDVNSNNLGRNYFEILCKKLENFDLQSHISKYYFDYKIGNDCRRFGTKHDKNRLLYTVPAFCKDNYTPWLHCSSAQIIIEIDGD